MNEIEDLNSIHEEWDKTQKEANILSTRLRQRRESLQGTFTDIFSDIRAKYSARTVAALRTGSRVDKSCKFIIGCSVPYLSLRRTGGGWDVAITTNNAVVILPILGTFEATRSAWEGCFEKACVKLETGSSLRTASLAKRIAAAKALLEREGLVVVSSED